MRIVLVGAQGTGKTTALKVFSKIFNLQPIYEGAINLLKELNYNWRNSSHEKNLMFESVLLFYDRYKIGLMKKYKNFIADRCSIDIMAYLNYHYENIPDRDLKRTLKIVYFKMIQECLKNFNFLKNNIDLIVFCRNYRIEDDIAPFIDKKIEEILIHHFRDTQDKIFISKRYPSTDFDLIETINTIMIKNMLMR